MFSNGDSLFIYDPITETQSLISDKRFDSIEISNDGKHILGIYSPYQIQKITVLSSDDAFKCSDGCGEVSEKILGSFDPYVAPIGYPILINDFTEFGE